MKGILKKTQSGWIINYDYTVNKNDWCTLPLHPADVEQINKDSQVFDNIEARIASNPEVEFEMVTEYWSGEIGVNGLTYAKLIHHSVESNEMIDHIGDANKMVEDDKELFYQKQVMNPYPSESQSYTSYEKGFVEGYNKAKETFYTEEDMKKAFRYGMGIGEWQMKDDFGAWVKALKHIKK
jgi:hypothetical protein